MRSAGSSSPERAPSWAGHVEGLLPLSPPTLDREQAIAGPHEGLELPPAWQAERAVHNPLRVSSAGPILDPSAAFTQNFGQARRESTTIPAASSARERLRTPCSARAYLYSANFLPWRMNTLQASPELGFPPIVREPATKPSARRCHLPFDGLFTT